jgi:hypothetical protein
MVGCILALVRGRRHPMVSAVVAVGTVLLVLRSL